MSVVIKSTFGISATALRITTMAFAACGAALGAYIGGESGKADMQLEYEKAAKQTVVAHLSKTVSPEVAHTVEKSISQEKNWVKTVEAQKMLVDAQAHAR